MTALHVLVVHEGLAVLKDESVDVMELLTGMLEASAAGSGDLRVTACYGGRLHHVELVDGQPRMTDAGPLRRLWRHRPDVAHVWLPIPLRQLFVALLVRLLGRPVLLSPMAMLGDDFAASSWFRSPRRWGTVKVLEVRLLRWLWSLVAAGWVLLSEDERRQVRRRRGPTALMPYAFFPSPVAAAASPSHEGVPVEAHRPLAFVSRLDPHRKGLDRLGRWLLTYADDLPRPAVILFAPADSDLPDDLERARAQGLVRWDSATRGADLAPHLRRCRGVALLSRFDGQPRVLREAAQLGIPTLSTPSSGFGEVVHAIRQGVIVDGDHPASIQAGFESLGRQLHDEELPKAFFDRASVGRFWWSLLDQTSATHALPNRSYAEEFGRQQRTAPVEAP